MTNAFFRSSYTLRDDGTFEEIDPLTSMYQQNARLKAKNAELERKVYLTIRIPRWLRPRLR